MAMIDGSPIDDFWCIMRAEPGEHVDHFAERVARAAAVSGLRILAEHNQYTLDAVPGTTARALLRQRFEQMRVAGDLPG